MARIRIVDAWVRSPTAPVSRQRAVMVVAEKWAEQRVLMRAYANSADQTRPTIVLHGNQLAIGPAGTDESAAWGIHVEPPADGRAQELRAQLELAARRLAGSKGNPPRLMDEAPSFDGKATNLWEPGTPADLAPASGHIPSARPYYEPSASSASVPAASGSVPSAGASMSVAPHPHGFGPPPPAPPRPEPPRSASESARVDPGPPPPAPPLGTGHAANRSYRGWSSPVASAPPLRDVGAPGPTAPGAGWPASSARMPVKRSRNSVKTQRGIALGHGASWHGAGAGAVSAEGQNLGAIIRRTMPPGFQLSPVEGQVLDALGRSSALTAGQIEHLTHASDGAAWMERFLAKLAGFGLDLVEHGGYVNGEATYLLSTALRK